MRTVFAVLIFVLLIPEWAISQTHDLHARTYEGARKNMSSPEYSFEQIESEIRKEKGGKSIALKAPASKTCSQRCSTKCSVSCTTTRGCSTQCKTQSQGCSGGSTQTKAVPSAKKIVMVFYNEGETVYHDAISCEDLSYKYKTIEKVEALKLEFTLCEKCKKAAEK